MSEYYPRLIRLRHRLLRLESRWQAILTWFLCFAFILTYFRVSDIKNTAEAIVVVSAPALLLINALVWLVLKYQRKAQVESNEVASSLRTFSNSERFAEIFEESVHFGDGRAEIVKPIIPFSFIRCAEERDMERINQINLDAFARSPWSDNAARKSRRNNAIFAKNPHAFFVIDKFSLRSGRLILEDDAPRPIFFSCILPLNKLGFQRYFTEKVGGDNAFRADWVAAPTEPTECLLMFTIARDLAAVRDMAQGRDPDVLGFYMRCCGVHIEQLLRAQGLEGAEVPVYFQNSDTTFERLASLMKMHRTLLSSADAEAVYVTNICLRAG